MNNSKTLIYIKASFTSAITVNDGKTPPIQRRQKYKMFWSADEWLVKYDLPRPSK